MYKYTLYMPQAHSVFSRKFSSAGKGPFIAGKAENMQGEQGGSGVRDMAPPLLGNLGAKFSEMSETPTCILRKSAFVTFTQQFKAIDSKNFTFFNVLFPKCVVHNKKSV